MHSRGIEHLVEGRRIGGHLIQFRGSRVGRDDHVLVAVARWLDAVIQIGRGESPLGRFIRQRHALLESSGHHQVSRAGRQVEAVPDAVGQLDGGPRRMLLHGLETGQSLPVDLRRRGDVLQVRLEDRGVGCILRRAAADVAAEGQDLVAHEEIALPAPQVCRRRERHGFQVLHEEAVIAQAHAADVCPRVVVAMGVSLLDALFPARRLQGLVGVLLDGIVTRCRSRDVVPVPAAGENVAGGYLADRIARAEDHQGPVRPVLAEAVLVIVELVLVVPEVLAEAFRGNQPVVATKKASRGVGLDPDTGRSLARLDAGTLQVRDQAVNAHALDGKAARSVGKRLSPLLGEEVLRVEEFKEQGLDVHIVHSVWMGEVGHGLGNRAGPAFEVPPDEPPLQREGGRVFLHHHSIGLQCQLDRFHVVRAVERRALQQVEQLGGHLQGVGRVGAGIDRVVVESHPVWLDGAVGPRLEGKVRVDDVVQDRGHHAALASIVDQQVVRPEVVDEQADSVGMEIVLVLDRQRLGVADAGFFPRNLEERAVHRAAIDDQIADDRPVFVEQVRFGELFPHQEDALDEPGQAQRYLGKVAGLSDQSLFQGPHACGSRVVGQPRILCQAAAVSIVEHREVQLQHLGVLVVRVRAVGRSRRAVGVR